MSKFCGSDLYEFIRWLVSASVSLKLLKSSLVSIIRSSFFLYMLKVSLNSKNSLNDIYLPMPFKLLFKLSLNVLISLFIFSNLLSETFKGLFNALFIVLSSLSNDLSILPSRFSNSLVSALSFSFSFTFSTACACFSYEFVRLSMSLLNL